MITLKEQLKTTTKYSSILEKNNIKTIKDLLHYFPRSYEDRTYIKPLSELIINEKWIATTKGKILKKSFSPRRWKNVYECSFVDEQWILGKINIFNSWFLASKIKENQRYIIIGKPFSKQWKIIFNQPECIPTGDTSQEQNDISNIGRIYPIYSELYWIKSNRFAEKIRNILSKIDEIFDEYLPEEFLKRYNLLWVKETFKNIHFPESNIKQQDALKRIFFDRLLRVQLHSLLQKSEYSTLSLKKTNKSIPNWKTIKEFLEKLPFTLTNAQKKVIKHCIESIHEEKPMMTLLQWDVGSGKTVVAATIAHYIYHIKKQQSIFIAPLEVLANQHYKTLAKLFLPLWIRCELLTGSISKNQKIKIKQDIKDNKIPIVIWTHALFQEDISFTNLWFVVIDEQHKFWVRQRAFFKKVGNPDVLQMSATPIPRSMALAFFWEFDVQIIDELPKGRQPINTKIISENEYIKLKPRILSKIKEHQKVFIVTPLVEDSEKLEEVKAATSQYEEVKNLFPELKGKIWLLHWKMTAKDKEETMNKFQNNTFCLLVSTTVIEVGVDIPEATIMIIKNSERFGLSQLHQLRWRIGRSDLKSYCFLETQKKSWDSYKRLKAMEETNDWFKLAELDLKSRWPWEILGTIQAWQTDIPIEILSDLKFIEKVQEWAKWLLEKYPNLVWLEKLKKYLEEKIGDILA